MGDYANDLIDGSIRSEGYHSTKQRVHVPKEAEFEVSIIHRKTGKACWTGTVNAGSKKDAQGQFRKKYAHIRSQYSHDYGLSIKLINKRNESNH